MYYVFKGMKKHFVMDVLKYFLKFLIGVNICIYPPVVGTPPLPGDPGSGVLPVPLR